MSLESWLQREERKTQDAARADGLVAVERDPSGLALSDTARVGSADSGQHYRYSYRGVKLDPYRIIDAYGITHPAQQHAIKKLLRAGKSVKSLRQDIQEVQDALTRWLEMLDEDQRA